MAMMALATFASAHAQRQLVLNTKPGAPVQPTMYGIFFEDINFGADGGLYADMVENRSFEFPQHLMAWQTFGNVEVEDDDPAAADVTFWAQNWRKCGLSDRRNQLLREYGFYNQQYCGCEFSQRTV